MTLALRNLSIIAHVDHGKTTLVDSLLQQAGLFRESAEKVDRVMDRLDLERERGLTIMAKNTAFHYGDTRLNIVDTPGHADFGGEVERSLAMVDGAVLLVDAAEGPLPQTRFVLEKALAAGIALIVVINKVDRSDARPGEVLDEMYGLFIDLGADGDALDFPVVYAIGRDGRAGLSPDDLADDLRPLLDTILATVPPPHVDPDGPTAFQAAILDYDDYVGRLALGRIHGGELVRQERYAWCGEAGIKPVRLSELYTFEGLRRVPVDRAGAGDIVAVAGIKEIGIGDSLCDLQAPAPLPRISIDEPTVSVCIGINNGPLGGQDGTQLTGRQIRERLERESMTNVSIRVQPTDAPDTYQVAGRGELQLGILVETMRREGFEMTVSRPEVLEKIVDGKRHEPFEVITVDLPDSMIGAATEQLARRKAKMLEMTQIGSGRTRLRYRVASRALIGFRSEFINQTRGQAVIQTQFDGWDARVEGLPRRTCGAMVADRTGKVTGYAALNLQPRGTLFVVPGDAAYEGMIVGQHNRGNDLNVNIVRLRKLTNVRSANAEETVVLESSRRLSLEEAIEWVDSDELVEVTPGAVRLRKKILNSSYRTVRREEL